LSIFCVFLENEWIQLSDIGTIDYQLLIRGRAPSHGSIQFDTALTVTVELRNINKFIVCELNGKFNRTLNIFVGERKRDNHESEIECKHTKTHSFCHFPIKSEDRKED